MSIPCWGELFGKIASWFPGRREAMQNGIDDIKKEMENVINKKPFDVVRYKRLADKLWDAERRERRAN